MTGSSITLCDYPLEQALDIFRGAGFTRVEMWVHHLKRCTTPALRRAFSTFAESLGLQMGGLNVVGEDYFRPFGTDSERKETLRMLESDMLFAQALGTRDVLIWEGRAPTGSSESQWIDRLLPGLIELLQESIKHAKPLGMRILVEPHPFTVGMSDKFLIRLCDALDPEHFGVTYDFCHYGVARKHDYVQAIHALGPRIRHLHFSDSDLESSELHFPAGRGRMNIEAILKALREIDYDGTMAMDLYGYPTPVEALSASATRFREALDYLGIPAQSST